jgi:putative membrane protein
MQNPPSERRLHPVSFLFQLASQGRELLLPGLFVLLAGARSESWQIFGMILFVPYALVAVARALVFRYSLEPEELVIRSGLIVKQERHIPYGRIQNIDAIQNVIHRALGVVQVRLETGGGEEPEATLSVVSSGAFEEIRDIIHAARAAQPAEPALSEPLLRLSNAELVKCGLIQGRGLLVIGAIMGLAWETGLVDRITRSLFGDDVAGRGIVRQMAAALVGQGTPPLRTIALTLGAAIAILVVTRLFSVGWALVRLHGFTLRQSGGDLRATFGLVTRVTATIPIRRIQSVTIHEGPWHRMFGRVSVRVETAGGGGADESVKLQRQWLAPVVPHERLAELLQHVLPSVEQGVEWRAVEARGVRRARVSWLVLATFLSVWLVLLLRWWTPVLFAAVALIGEVDARRSVRAMRWGTNATGVFFRSGWISRRQTVAPFSKVQAVSVRESPFDRRYSMAAVRVDTAGSSSGDHQIYVPYLGRETARALAVEVASHAARTEFRW